LLAAADMALFEPGWLKLSHLNLAGTGRTARFVYFTDIHHKGDGDWLTSVVTLINALKPDFVCFGGDIVEDKAHLTEALAILGQIKSPLFGVPGNHDYWSAVDFSTVAQAFAATGGAWLMDTSATVAGGKIQLHGLTRETGVVLPPKPGVKNILLAHYPNWCEKVAPHQFDLMLAGH